MSAITQIAATPWKPLNGAVANRYNGNLYVRLVKVVFNGGLGFNQSWMGMFKSSDDGVTWSQVDVDKLLGDYNSTNSTFIPGCGTINPSSPSILNVSYNFYEFGVVTQISELNIARFDMAADAWLTDTLGPSWSGPRFLIGYAQNSQINFRSDNTVVIQYRHTQEAPPSASNLDHTSRVWTLATGEQIMSTVVGGNPTGFIDWDLYGHVSIDSTGVAHLFYLMSASGSSTLDVSLMYRQMDSLDVLSAESVVAFTTGVSGAWGKVAIVNGIVEDIVLGANTQAGLNITPTMFIGPAASGPVTPISFGSPVPRGQQLITNIGNTAYGVWAYAQGVGSRLLGIQVASFLNGAWGAAFDVNTGAGGEPPFTAYTINGISDGGGNALVFVMENWNDETAWFAIYPIGSGGSFCKYEAW